MKRRPGRAPRNDALRAAMTRIADYERTLSAALRRRDRSVSPASPFHGVTDRERLARAGTDAVRSA